MPLELESVLERIRSGNYLITAHGYEELDNDLITIENLETSIANDDPEIIETYPDDHRGASCLILGGCEPDIPIHVCVGISGGEPEIITAYRPSSIKFYPPDFRRRR